MAANTAQKVADWFQNYNSDIDNSALSGGGILGTPTLANINKDGQGGNGDPNPDPAPIVTTPPTGVVPPVTKAPTVPSTGGPLLDTPAPTVPVTPATPQPTGGTYDPFGGVAPENRRLPPGGILNSTPTDPNSPVPPVTPATGILATPPANGITSTLTGQLNANGTTTITPESLTTRKIDPATETVAGQQNGLLSGNNPYIQGFKDRAVRQMNARGGVNSTMAASAGEEAGAKASLEVAAADAGIYGKAADYNTALANQGLMYNVDTQNQFQLQSNTIDGQKAIAAIQAASSASVAGINAAAQLSAASLSAETSRWNAQLSSETSRYNTDMNYRAQQDSQRNTLANNIINNMDMDPARKQALLDAMGLGALGKAVLAPDPEMIGQSNGGTLNGGRRELQGQHQIFLNGQWVVDTAFGPDGRLGTDTSSGLPDGMKKEEGGKHYFTIGGRWVPDTSYGPNG